MTLKFNGDSITFNDNTVQTTAAKPVAAVDWTANHTLLDGTRYLVNDLVHSSGILYRAKAENESEPVTNDTYWENLGAGYRLNIDGRDVPNLPQQTSVEQASSIVTTVFNETGSQIPKMTAVYIDGGHGDRPTVSLALATGDPTSAGTYGVTLENIDNMELGQVIVFGALTGVNTDPAHGGIAGATEGSTLYLSPTTPGGLTTTKPSAPNHMVVIGTVVRVHQNVGVIEVRIQNGFELNELHDVNLSGLVDGNLIRYHYDSLTPSASYWAPYSLDANDIDFSNVPTTDPIEAGKVWIDTANGNVLKVSTGV